MVNGKAEITPSLGLGGLLLGQSLGGLNWEEHWQETGSIVRGTLAEGSVQVVGDSALDRVIGLVALPGYRGRLPQGIGLGMTFAEALRHAPQLRFHDLEPALYEPDQLGFMLRPLDFEGSPAELLLHKVASVHICDWAHDYWTFARPLLSEEECDARGL